MRATLWLSWLLAASGGLLGGCAAGHRLSTAVPPEADVGRITLLYDAFGKTPGMEKDWGFAALIEYGGKRILFDTGDNAEILARNVKAKGVDLSKLDFVVVSHRHGDHTSGLSYLLQVNPSVKIYVPKENFGVFGAALPGTFYRHDESLPAHLRYFDGRPPDTLRFGSPWPRGNFVWVTQTSQVAPGVYLILLKGSWGVDLDVMELSLAIDTPKGIVLVVGCGHPTIEKIAATARATIDRPLYLVVGGLHLLAADDDEISRIATALHDAWKVEWIAPAHCTGERAFAIFRRVFGARYLYAGVGTVLAFGTTVESMAGLGRPLSQTLEPVQPHRPSSSELGLEARVQPGPTSPWAD